MCVTLYVLFILLLIFWDRVMEPVTGIAPILYANLPPDARLSRNWDLYVG